MQTATKYTHRLYLRAKRWLRRRTRKQIMLSCLASVVLFCLALLVLFMWPKQLVYSFGSVNCFANPVIFPGTVTSSTDRNLYRTDVQPALSIGSRPIFSLRSCLTLTRTPQPNAQSTVTLRGGAGLRKTIHVRVNALPAPVITTDLTQPVSPSETLQFRLDQPDVTFSYVLTIAKDTHTCETSGRSVGCNLESYKLKQGVKHSFVLQRRLSTDSASVVSSSITLRKPVTIQSSSIHKNQMVYGKPTRLIVTANKSLSSVDGITVRSGKTEVPVSVAVKNRQAIITFKKQLPRQAALTVTIRQATATDKAYLPKPYQLKFRTSGGPKVRATSIGSYRTGLRESMYLYFDSKLAGGQNLSKYISIATPGGTVAAIVSASGKTAVITPARALPACTGITLRVANGLANYAGVTGGSAWSFTSRTLCQQVTTIGYSVQGRPILAYQFGSGGAPNVFVGGTHGDELSSIYTLNSFIDDMERTYTATTYRRPIVVIPILNPDGYAAGRRLNAHNVDLNRNFPSADWKKDSYEPGDVLLKNGGGSKPLSEPESRAIASYLTSRGPRAVLTFHAKGGAVFAEGNGDSASLARLYANTVGHPIYSGDSEDGVFTYPTTGEMEAWLHDKTSIPCILIELSYISGNEYYAHAGALRAIARQ